MSLSPRSSSSKTCCRLTRSEMDYYSCINGPFILQDLSAEETVALISALIFEEKDASEPVLNPKLEGVRTTHVSVPFRALIDQRYPFVSLILFAHTVASYMSCLLIPVAWLGSRRHDSSGGGLGEFADRLWTFYHGKGYVSFSTCSYQPGIADRDIIVWPSL
jgi:hypothetical protein